MNDYNNNQMPTFVPSNVYEERTKKIRPSDLVLNLGVIALTISILIMGGMFAYGKVLDNGYAKKEAELLANKNVLGGFSLAGISKINNQSLALGEVLSAHTYFSNILGLLESATNDNVTWSKLDVTSKDTGLALLNLSGEALSNAVVVQQVDALKSKTALVKSVALVKSSFDDKTLKIKFDLEVTIDPKLSTTN